MNSGVSATGHEVKLRDLQRLLSSVMQERLLPDMLASGTARDCTGTNTATESFSKHIEMTSVNLTKFGIMLAASEVRKSLAALKGSSRQQQQYRSAPFVLILIGC